MASITNHFTYVPDFFGDFEVTCDEEKAYAAEVFEVMEWARDLVLDMMDNNDVVFVEDVFDMCTCDAEMDACGVYLIDLARRYPVGDSYLGEWVGDPEKAEECEAEYLIATA